MRKLFITLLLFIFYVSPAWGVVLIQTADIGGSCATQSVVSSQLYASATSTSVYGNNLTAQSFQVPSDNTEVHSVTVYIDRDAGSSDQTWTIRIDDDTDLRTVAEGAASEPLAEATYEYINDTVGEAVFVFDVAGRPTLDSATTYYFAVGSDNGLYGDRIWLDGRASGDPDYPDGVIHDWDGATEWNLDNYVVTRYDAYFKINACD